MNDDPALQPASQTLSPVLPGPLSSSGLKRSLTIATAIMMGSVFLSRIIGLVREQVLAYYGGTSYEIDAYVTSFFIPEILNHLLAGGFLSVTFIPIFQKHMVRDDMPGAWRSMSNLLTIGSLFFIILIPLSIIFTPEIMTILGTDAVHKPLTIKLTRIILPAQLFFYWGAFLGAVQMANNKFFLFALAPLLYNLGIITGGIVLLPWLGIEGFSWGVLAGAVLGNFLLQVPGVMKIGIRYRPRFDLRDPDLLTYVKTTVPLILGLGMSFSIEIFFRFFSSYLREGGTASVNYALRTMMMVVAVFGQASGVAFYPYLSRFAAEKEYGKMTHLLNAVLTRIALYLVPISGIMIVLSPQIVSVLYQHGNFSAMSTARTAPVLTIFLLGAFAFSGSMIVQRSFYAMQQTVLPMIISTIVALISIPAYMLLSSAFGPKGIALAAVCGMIAQFFVLYALWCRKHSDKKSVVNALGTFMKSLLITVGAMAMCWGIQYSMYHFSHWIPVVFPVHRIIRDLIVCCVAGGVSLAVVFSLYELLGLQRIRDSIRGIIHRSV
jgi:putative peptidoglycan lipid II flippase